MKTKRMATVLFNEIGDMSECARVCKAIFGSNQNTTSVQHADVL